MASITGYSVGVQAVFTSKIAASSLNGYDYPSTALAQAFQIHTTTNIVAKTLQAYNRSTLTFPWYVRVLAIVALPFSVCFEINRWSSEYQPAFWKKKTVHWICDHTEPFIYAFLIVSSVALAAIGQSAILAGIVITSSINQIQKYNILPSYCCLTLKTINMLASTFFAQGAFSCLISIAFLVTEVVSSAYFFSQPVRQKPPVNELITNKTIEDVKNNHSHIHFEPLIEGNVEDILAIFNEINWLPTQCKQLLKELSKDPFWIKRVDVNNTNPLEYIQGFHREIEELIDKIQRYSDPNQKALLELYLKVIIQYLRDHSTRLFENKKLILNIAIQLRSNPQSSIDHLRKTAEECYKKIKSLSLEQQILRLLYEKRKKIFNQLFDQLFAEESTFHIIANQEIKEFFKPFIQNTFDFHMGINFFSKDQTCSLFKGAVYAEYADEGIDVKSYFCDQENGQFYNPQAIIDLLINEIELPLSEAINSWLNTQNIHVDLVGKIAQIQIAEKYLKILYKVKMQEECSTSNLLKGLTGNINVHLRGIKADCRRFFEVLKIETQEEGGSEEFANKVCSSVAQAAYAYPKIEKSLVSLLLKMGIFQLKP